MRDEDDESWRRRNTTEDTGTEPVQEGRNGYIEVLVESASMRLLPTLKDLDPSVSADTIQIFVFLDRPLPPASATSDPHDSTDVLGRAGVQQPQAEHRLSLVSQRQRKRSVFPFQRCSLRRDQGLVRGDCQNCRVNFL